MAMKPYKIDKTLGTWESTRDINLLVKYSEHLGPLNAKINDLQSDLFTASGSENPLLALDSLSHAPEQPSEIAKLPLEQRILSYLKTTHVSIGGPSQAVDKLVDLRDRISSLPEMQITLPLSVEEFSDEFNDYLFFFLKDLLASGKPYILDRSVDRSILGGLKIYWEGRYHDLTLATRLQSFYRKEMVNVLG
jgi:hypothetical protein